MSARRRSVALSTAAVLALTGLGAAVLHWGGGGRPAVEVEAGRRPEPSSTTSAPSPDPSSTSTTVSNRSSTTTTRRLITTTTTAVTTTTAPACAVPGQFGPYVFSLATTDGSEGLVTGTRAVRITADGGQTWTAACLPDGVASSVRGLTRRGRNAWAVAGTPAEPVMLRSTDRGRTWRAVPMPAGGMALNDLTFVDERHGWIVGTRPVTDTTNPLLGAGAVVFRTSDGGTTWALEHDFPPAEASRLARVAFVDATNGFAIGQNSAGRPILLATIDAGATWTPRSVPEGVSEVRDLFFADAQRAWLLGLTYEDAPDGSRPTVGIVLASDDGGSSWTEQWRRVGFIPFDLDFTDAGRGHVIGGDNLGASWLVSTADGGTTWAQQAVPGRSLTVVDFADADHGWAAGMQGACLRVTGDGGATWTSRPIEGNPSACQ